MHRLEAKRRAKYDRTQASVRLVDVTSPEAQELIARTDSARKLQVWLTEEEGRSKPRTKVLSALRAKLDQVS